MGKLMIRNAGDSAWITIAGVGTVVQQDAEPSNPHAGMMWLDTDATTGLQSMIRDADGDTYVTCEETADVDQVAVYVAGHLAGLFFTGAFTSGLVLQGEQNQDSIIIFAADESDDNADYWRIINEADDNTLSIETFATGSYLGVVVMETSGEVTKPLQPMLIATADDIGDIATGGSTKHEWTETVDIGADFADHKFTCSVDGLYRIKCSMLLDATTVFTAVEYWDLIIYINGTQTKYHRVTPDNTGNHYIHNVVEAVLDLDANDFIEIYTYQNSGSNITVYQIATFSWLEVSLLQ